MKLFRKVAHSRIPFSISQLHFVAKEGVNAFIQYELAIIPKDLNSPKVGKRFPTERLNHAARQFILIYLSSNEDSLFIANFGKSK